MKKKYIQVANLDLAYLEYNCNAERTIYFVHGNSGSSSTWRNQLNHPSLSEYRQIAIDLPGHGDSSRSTNPAEDYAPISTAKIVAQAISILSNAAPFVVVGFSYATNLLAEMMAFDINPSGMVLIGLCCLGKDFGMDRVFKPSDVPSIFFYNEKNRNTVEHFVEANVKSSRDVEMVTTDYLNTDEQFRPSLMKAAGEGKISDEILALQIAGFPLCIINGALDKLVYSEYIRNANLRFWGGDIIVHYDTQHFVHLDQPEEVTRIVATFAKDVLTPTRASTHNS